MDDATTSLLRSQLADAISSFQKAEARAIAGQVSLEVMHEFRNPLEALENLTYLAMTNAENPGQVREYMHMAQEQLAILAAISNQTLGLVRAQAKSTCLVVVIEAALRVHQAKIQAKGIQIIREFPATLMAEVHMGEILQVASNLIDNAVAALPEKGRLRLRLRKHGTEAHLVIADTGYGIPKEHLAKLYGPFFTTKQEAGTGLGLALSRKIVERHRGKIRVRSSVRPGRSGTTFRITLPIAELPSVA
jgi:signal transduction histidine kinase